MVGADNKQRTEQPSSRGRIFWRRKDYSLDGNCGHPVSYLGGPEGKRQVGHETGSSLRHADHLSVRKISVIHLTEKRTNEPKKITGEAA